MKRTSHQKIINDWLGKLRPEAGEVPSLDENGVCNIQCGEHIALVIEVPKEIDFIFFYVPLIAMPEDAVTAHNLMSKALEMNIFQGETRGGSLAMPPDRSVIVYCFFSPIESMDEEGFSDTLDWIYTTVLSLRGELQEVVEAGAVVGSVSDGDVPPGMLKL